MTVQSLGRFGTSTGAATILSTISGALSKLVVKSDIVGATVKTTGGADGKIGPITIGGSLIAVAAGSESGSILGSGDIGAVKIGGDLRGGGGVDSGELKVDGKLASATVGGSLVGGGGAQSGRIRANGDIGPVKIAGDVVGGTAGSSGQVRSVDGKIASITIGGSLLGGGQPAAGSIEANAGIGSAKVAVDVKGGGGGRSGGIFVDGSGNIGSVKIGGSVFSGTGTLSGFISTNGVLGSVQIAGSLIGTAANPVTIAARGNPLATGTTDVAIASVSITGHVEFAQILGGYSFDLSPLNADAQIGSVKVGGDWIASSIAAGVVDGGNGFGNSGDVKITDANDSATIFSKIASITIGGQVLGTIGGSDHFGFVAEQIGSFKVGGTTIPLSSDPAVKDNRAVGVTGDVTILEI